MNPRQREAVSHGDGPLLVIAGAGSGKTRVLTYRIAYLLAMQKARPWNILALTFTNKAASEMRERIATLIGDDASKLWMGTFHSIFSRILRVEAHRLGFTSDFSIYDTDDSERAVKTIIKEMGLEPKEVRPRDIRFRISNAKNQMITPQEYESKFIRSSLDEIAVQVYRIYLARLRQSNAMDFDDLLLLPIELFEDHPEVLEKYQQYFRYLLIDEYQDTNRAQYVVAKMLASAHRNITVVGDDAQSIYSFRGADITNILNFKEDYPDAAEIPLEQNYRSTATILKCADSVIKKNKKQLEKTLWTENQEGDPVTLLENYDQFDEANRISNYIHQLRLRKGYSPNDFAVLYRTNYQSRAFEESLRKKGINYQLVGAISFYQRKEIKDVLAYLRLLINPDDEEALMRVINEPARGIGDKSLSVLTANARKEHTSVWNILQKADGLDVYGPAKTRIREFVETISEVRKMLDDGTFKLTDVAKKLMETTGYIKQYVEENSTESLARRDNVLELVTALSQFERERPDATLSNFLQEISLYSDTDSFDPEKPAITLMTVHASKGLEFPVVFVAGIEEDLFPMKPRNGDESDIEEERRLFYVAVTRAKKELFFSYARSRSRYGDEIRTKRSRFLDEVDPGVVRTETGASIRQKSAPQVKPKSSASGYQIEYDWQRGHQTRGRKQAAAPKPQASKQERMSYDGTMYEVQNPSQLRVGMQVWHDNFGIGKIMGVEGSGLETKLTVFFQKHGQKKLLYRLANLKVVM